MESQWGGGGLEKYVECETRIMSGVISAAMYINDLEEIMA